uniref:Sodium:solute symporter family protein n=1 Tax=Candidatus Kentrum sp. LPFa TaxID=2126335 RepID=A0A450WHN2_9GAMM|nr:MAG: hypothetical protein BECKLPF1236B_GA0070989_109715 [Candidatus Kentron sp. LPFa]
MTEGVNESNVLTKVIELFSNLSPWAYAALVVALLIVFFAATLSTLDGQLLASAKAMIFDAAKVRNARDFLLGRQNDSGNEERLFKLSDVAMVVIAIVICGVTYAFHAGALSLFDMVYVAVIGQMSLVLPTLFMLYGLERYYRGFMGILLGLTAGGVAVVLNVMQIPTIMGIDNWLYIAPIATLLFGFLAIRVGMNAS